MLQHRPGFQLISGSFTKDLVAAKAVITQILYCAEDLDVFATATTPFDEIDDIYMTAADGLSSRGSVPRILILNGEL